MDTFGDRRDMELGQSRALREELEAAIARGQPSSVLAEIVMTSPFIEALVRQFTARGNAGYLFGAYDQVAEDWRSVTRITVWKTARSGECKPIRKSLGFVNFGAFWNRLVRLKAMTARKQVFRESHFREVTGQHFLEPEPSSCDGPESRAEYSEMELSLTEVADGLSKDLDRRVMRAILDGSYDPDIVVRTSGYCRKSVLLAAARAKRLIESMLGARDAEQASNAPGS